MLLKAARLKLRMTPRPTPHGQETVPAEFDIGLLTAADWGGARWLGGESDRQLRVDLPPLRTGVCRARVCIGLGRVIALCCHSYSYYRIS